MSNSGFPVGQTVLQEHKAESGTAMRVLPEEWVTVCVITIPAGAFYLVTLQIRMPRRAWAESRMVRVGWGRDADGFDETGYHTFRPRPDGHATSDSFTHDLAGGGVLAFQIKLHPRDCVPGVPVEVATIVCKAHRTD